MTYRFQRRLKALLIDDDLDFGFFMKRIVRALDIDLVSVQKKEDFNLLLKRMNPDLCLIDLGIEGGGDGFALIESVRAKNQNAKIFVVSSRAEDHDVAQALALGANDYFSKPIQRALLERKLAYYFGESVSAAPPSAYRAALQEHGAVQVDVAARVTGVDEFGVYFVSSHLIPKGTRLRLSGEMIASIAGVPSIAVSVASNGLERRSDRYVYYAEFDDAGEVLLTSVRKWLSVRTVG